MQAQLSYIPLIHYLIDYNNRKIDIALSEPYPCVGIGSKYLRYIGTYLT